MDHNSCLVYNIYLKSESSFYKHLLIKIQNVYVCFIIDLLYIENLFKKYRNIKFIDKFSSIL